MNGTPVAVLTYEKEKDFWFVMVSALNSSWRKEELKAGMSALNRSLKGKLRYSRHWAEI